MKTRVNGLLRLPMKALEKNPYPLISPAVKKISLPGKLNLSDWIDLMEMVEMLCPVWPAPDPIRATANDYRL